MKIGLVRHFKVNMEHPNKLFNTHKEVQLWFEKYDNAGVEYQEVDLKGVNWKKCYSSDLPRALSTAEKFYQGEIVKMKELRELEPLVILKGISMLPFVVRAFISRAFQLLSYKHMVKFKKNIKEALVLILSESEADILIVSHFFTMVYLKKELRKRGFRGDTMIAPQNGKLYIFEKEPVYQSCLK